MLNVPLTKLENADKFNCEQESSDPETDPAKGRMAGDATEGTAAWQMFGRADGTVATL